MATAFFSMAGEQDGSFPSPLTRHLPCLAEERAECAALGDPPIALLFPRARLAQGASVGPVQARMGIQPHHGSAGGLT